MHRIALDDPVGNDGAKLAGDERRPNKYQRSRLSLDKLRVHPRSLTNGRIF